MVKLVKMVKMDTTTVMTTRKNMMIMKLKAMRIEEVLHGGHEQGEHRYGGAIIKMAWAETIIYPHIHHRMMLETVDDMQAEMKKMMT